jgi:hypothetical protein
MKFFTVSVFALLSSSAFAQEVITGQPPQPPPIVLGPAEMESLKEIIQKTIPPYYSGEVTRWYNAMVMRAMGASPTGQEPSVLENETLKKRQMDRKSYLEKMKNNAAKAEQRKDDPPPPHHPFVEDAKKKFDEEAK